jgi:hypothetical protein
MTWTTPRTWVATETVTASLLNTHLRDNLSDLQTRLTGASSSFTLTSAGSVNITIGNAVQANGWKLLSEKFAWFRIHLTFGTTSAWAGIWEVGPLPFTVVGTNDQEVSVLARDNSNNFKYTLSARLNGTLVRAFSGLDGSTGLSDTNPFTWATSDEIMVQGVAETT